MSLAANYCMPVTIMRPGKTDASTKASEVSEFSDEKVFPLLQFLRRRQAKLTVISITILV